MGSPRGSDRGVREEYDRCPGMVSAGLLELDRRSAGTAEALALSDAVQLAPIRAFNAWTRLNISWGRKNFKLRSRRQYLLHPVILG